MSYHKAQQTDRADPRCELCTLFAQALSPTTRHITPHLTHHAAHEMRTTTTHTTCTLPFGPRLRDASVCSAHYGWDCVADDGAFAHCHRIASLRRRAGAHLVNEAKAYEQRKVQSPLPTVRHAGAWTRFSPDTPSDPVCGSVRQDVSCSCSFPHGHRTSHAVGAGGPRKQGPATGTAAREALTSRGQLILSERPLLIVRRDMVKTRNPQREAPQTSGSTLCLVAAKYGGARSVLNQFVDTALQGVWNKFDACDTQNHVPSPKISLDTGTRTLAQRDTERPRF